VFDLIEHNGRNKARIVARGHLTEKQVASSVHPGVVNLRALLIVMFLIAVCILGHNYIEGMSNLTDNLNKLFELFTSKIYFCVSHLCCHTSRKWGVTAKMVVVITNPLVNHFKS
jgi:hypothetical protein